MKHGTLTRVQKSASKPDTSKLSWVKPAQRLNYRASPISQFRPTGRGGECLAKAALVTTSSFFQASLVDVLNRLSLILKEFETRFLDIFDGFGLGYRGASGEPFEYHQRP